MSAQWGRGAKLHPNRVDRREPGKRKTSAHHGSDGKSTKVLPMLLETVFLKHKSGAWAQWDERPRFLPGFWSKEECSDACRGQVVNVPLHTKHPCRCLGIPL